ncbi:MAG TPA: hypothetical protein VM681_01640 [Candidatus Thermoplasmatota archaeon]|nr:hypothetical protein [Candidatus Thermoplasmatota archaeon]
MLPRRAAVLSLLAVTTVLAGCTDPTGLFSREDRTAAGELALDYLSNARYARLYVELDYVSGAAPNDAALQMLRQRISENTAKGGNVEINLEGGVPGRGAGHKYTLDEIRALERAHRSRFSGEGTAVLYVLYLDGGFARDLDASAKTLAAAYRGSSVVMFKGNIRDTSRSDDAPLPVPSLSPKPRERALEGAVLVHEFGHIVGLVNNGIPMITAREDPEHEKHSTNTRSVMYWAVESSAVLNLLDVENIPNDFDANDKADMRAARGG